MKWLWLLILTAAVVIAYDELNDDVLDDTSQFDSDYSTTHRKSRSSSGRGVEDNYELTAQEITDAAYYIMETRKHFNSATQEKAIFLLGLPNSGKSKLIEYMSNKSSFNNDIVKPAYSEIFPVITTTKNNVYIDCPNLENTQNASIDFARGYFTKKSFESVKNVKILLTQSFLNYNSDGTWLFGNSSETENNALFNLLFHTALLIRDMDKFNKSIALVITDFDKNLTDASESLDSEANIKEFIANNLLRAGEYINEKSPYSSEGKATTKLIKNLLTKKNGDYIYINVLNKSLVKTVNDNLVYLPIIKSDVKYTSYGNEKNSNFWYRRYFSSFMEAGSFLKMIFVFFKLID